MRRSPCICLSSIPPGTKDSSISMWLTSKIWPQTDIVFRQHPVQNPVNHSFIGTIFAETEKSSVNATFLLREQTTKNNPGVNVLEASFLLHTRRHMQSYMYIHVRPCTRLSLLLSLPTMSQPEARRDALFFPSPLPLLSREWGTKTGYLLPGRIGEGGHEEGRL